MNKKTKNISKIDCLNFSDFHLSSKDCTVLQPISQIYKESLNNTMNNYLLKTGQPSGTSREKEISSPP